MKPTTILLAVLAAAIIVKKANAQDYPHEPERKLQCPGCVMYAAILRGWIHVDGKPKPIAMAIHPNFKLKGDAMLWTDSTRCAEYAALRASTMQAKAVQNGVPAVIHGYCTEHAMAIPEKWPTVEGSI